jgi:hypothetical protein
VAAETRLSLWSRRAVVVLAALASIATSQARWSLEAKAPPGISPGAKGTLLTVEASREPYVSRRRPGGGAVLATAREDTAPWSNSGAYYLPPGFELSAVTISGHDCGSGGGMCSACEPPPGSFVRIANVEPVAPWSLSTDGAELIAHADNAGKTTSFTVEIDAGRPVDLEAVATSGDVARALPSIYQEPKAGDASRTQRFNVTWYPKDDKPADVHWIPRATVHGYCKGAGECRAPAGESVTIVSVAAR